MYPFRSKLTVLVAVGTITLLAHSGPFCGQALSGTIASWGYDNLNQVTGTPTGTGFGAIAGGGYHGLALSADIVPEPSTLFLALIGLALLPLWRSNLRRYSN